MALHAGFRYDKPLGGLIGISGAWLNGKNVFHKANRDTPCLICHGDLDSVLHLQYVKNRYKKDGVLDLTNVVW